MSEAAPVPVRIPRRPAPRERDGRPRHLQLVDAHARLRERRRRWLVRIWAVGIVISALLGVVVHALMAEAQMRVAQIEERTATEARRYEEVRLSVAMRQTPATIVEQARALGLVPAPDTRTVGLPGNAGDRDATGDGAASDSSRSTAPWETVKPNLGSNP